MKKKTVKVLLLALVVLMIVPAMVGCGGEKMTITVGAKLGQDYIDYMIDVKNADDETYTIPAEDRVLLNDVEIEIEYEEGEQVSALRAIQEACANHGLDCFTNEDETSMVTLKSYSGSTETFRNENGDVETLVFFWTYTINGVEPTGGRMSTNYVKDGDKIQFILTAASSEDNVDIQGELADDQAAEE